MATVDLLDRDEYEEVVKEFDERHRQYTGTEEMTAYAKAAGHYPPVLEHLAEKHLSVMPTDDLGRRTKETVALVVSMVNGCQYCINVHSETLGVMFDVTDGELVEIATAAGHIAGMVRLEQSLLGDEEPLFPRRSPEDVPLLADIEDRLGVLPEYYRVIANDGEYLECIWDQEQRLMLSGDLDRTTKEYVALAVSVALGAPRSTRLHKRLLTDLGESEPAVFEAVQVVETFVQNNVFTTGLQLETIVF